MSLIWANMLLIMDNWGTCIVVHQMLITLFKSIYFNFSLLF